MAPIRMEMANIMGSSLKNAEGYARGGISRQTASRLEPSKGQEMMRKFAFLAWIASAPLYAQDLLPGQWEITMESRVPQAGGWKPEPFTMSQCISAADAADPSRLISGLAVPGATGCSYTEKNYSGSTFRFALTCGGSYDLGAKGEVNFNASSFSGQIDATGNVAGQSTTFTNHITAKRTGECRG